MASLLPLYLREYYKNDPLYSESKIITSIYNNGFEGSLGDKLIDKIKFDSIADDKLELISKASYNNLIKIAIENSDGVVKACEEISDELSEFIKQKDIPLLDYYHPEDIFEQYSNFYLT